MALLEQKVFERVLLVLLTSFVKIIHVQLSYKWRVIVVSEVHWQNCFRELFDFFYNESFTISSPWYDIYKFWVFEYFVRFQ